MTRIPARIRPVAGERLDSWKEIARYLKRDIRTVQRWEETDGLPIYRRTEGRQKGSPVYAYTSEIDAWLRRNPPTQAESEPEAAPATTSHRKTRLVVIAIGLFVFLAGGMITWRILYRQYPVLPLRVVPFTTYPGVERDPAFSPDGSQVAFSWNGPKQDNYDLYVKLLRGEEPLRLTTYPGVDGWPAWSPDGQLIVFGRWVLGASTVEALTVSPLGGAERKIYEGALPVQAGNYWPVFSWTPDSKWVIGPLASSPDAPAALVMVSVQTLKVRRLTQPVAGSAGDSSPAMAPDGHTLAFLRASSGRIWNLYLLSLGRDYQPIGPPRQFTAEPAGVENPMWTGDGRELLYIARREGARELWRIRSNGSRPTQVESVGSIGTSWAISPRGDRLIYSDDRNDRDVWRIDLEGEKRIVQVLSSSEQDCNPQIAPDGKRIAFMSGRENGNRIWVSGLNGENPIDVAPLSTEFPGPARWSPDGKQLVFECQNEANDDICSVPATGGPVRRLTWNPARDTLPSWSRDGNWIYVTSNRSGSFQIWKIPSDGTERGSIQLTKGGGFSAVESADGGTVYYSRERISSGIWKVPAGGGNEEPVGSFRMSMHSYNFAVGREGIYYMSSGDPERWFDLWLYRFSTGKSERVSRIDKRPWMGMSVSPDGRCLLFTASERRSANLYMVENFK